MKQAIKIGGKYVSIKDFEALPEVAAPRWTAEMDEVMRLYYPTKDTTALAAKLGVSRSACSRHASTIGIRKLRYRVKEEK